MCEANAAALANGEEVRLAGLGVLTVKGRAACTGHNPQTGEVLSISSTNTPSFEAGKVTKDVVKDG